MDGIDHTEERNHTGQRDRTDKREHGTGGARSSQRHPVRSLLGDSTWPEVPIDDPQLLVVPVGSCEQHGPHLPLATDTLLAEALARALADRTGGVLVSPSIGIGASGEHSSFPGTLSIGNEVLASVLVELARSALPPPASGDPRPFAAVLFVNGHGGNAAALRAAVSLLRSESRPVAAWHPRVPDGDLHAGETETSLMLHLHVGLVRAAEVHPGADVAASDITDALTSGRLAEVSPTGVLGDPTDASAQAGALCFEVLVDSLAAEAGELLADARDYRDGFDHTG